MRSYQKPINVTLNATPHKHRTLRKTTEVYPFTFRLQVQPKHVKEAFRLLNKSIIRVETPDINLEQEDDLEEEEQPQEEGTVALTHPPACVDSKCNHACTWISKNPTKC